MIKTHKVYGKLSSSEKEVLLHYDAVDNKWIMDTTIMKFYNKAIRQGWTQTDEYVYEDGTVCGGAFEAPAKAITIRDPNKKRVMSDEQMKNLHRHDEEDTDDED